MFHLFQLPSVALRHVLSVMDPSDQFFVSLIYPKVFKQYLPVIKSQYGTLLRHTNEEKFCFYKENSKGETFPLIRFHDLESRYSTEQKTLWKFGNKRIRVRFIYTENIIIIMYVPGFKDFLYSILLEHFTLIYGEPAFQNVSVSIRDSRPFPNIQKIRKLEMTDTTGHLVDDDLLRVLGKFTNPEIVDIQAHVEDSLRDSFDVIECLVSLYNSVFMSSSFEGKHFIVKRSDYSNMVILEFIQEWLKGRIWTELETVMILNNDLEPEEILRELKTEPYRPERRATRYTSTCKYQIPESDVFDCTNSVDVQRETDGKLASIKITRNQFFFFVWNN